LFSFLIFYSFLIFPFLFSNKILPTDRVMWGENLTLRGKRMSTRSTPSPAFFLPPPCKALRQAVKNNQTTCSYLASTTPHPALQSTTRFFLGGSTSSKLLPRISLLSPTAGYSHPNSPRGQIELLLVAVLQGEMLLRAEAQDG
jgi:hypothetical protein